MKVAVLGSGIIGTSTAWWLAQAGHEVVVVERRSAPALETSRAHDAGRWRPGRILREVQASIMLVRKDMEMMRKNLIIKIGLMFGVSEGLIIATVRYLS